MQQFAILLLIMAKQKKKRNKKYTGADAAVVRPSVTKVQAVSRSPLGQWWFDHKRIVKLVAIVSIVALFLIWVIFELVRLIFSF